MRRGKAEKGRRAYARGLTAERVAAAFLMAKGYRILARRYRTPVGEIDLVARKGKAVVFVEVKGRDAVAQGLEAVTPAAQARLARAAEHFAAMRPQLARADWRFDVVVVSGPRWPRHLRGAF